MALRSATARSVPTACNVDCRASRGPLREERRPPHRLHRRGRRPHRPDVDPAVDLAGRVPVVRGARSARVMRPARELRAADHLRPPRLGPVGPVLRRAHARGADGRRAGRDGRRRLRARGALRHARGRPAGDALRRHPPRARQRARPLRDLRARHLGARLRLGLAGRGARGNDGGAGRALGRGPHRRRASPPARSTTRPSSNGPGGWSACGQPGHDPQDPRADRRDRRARRAAVDPRADARDAPARRHVPQRRALALHRRAHPRRRAMWSSRAATACSRWATPTRCSARSRSS